MEVQEKVLANRLRRWAKRLGLEIRKSRVRSIHIDDHGKYMICTLDNAVVAGQRFDCSLADVEEFLADYEARLREERGD